MLEAGGTVSDFHSHLVPGVDDGAQTLEDALEAVQRMIDAGIGRVLTTPHLRGSLTHDRSELERRLAEVDVAWESISEAVQRRFPGVEFSRGHEVMLDVPDPDLSDVRLRLAGTDFVLIEWPRLQIPPRTEPVLRLGRAVLYHPTPRPGTDIAAACDYLLRVLRRRSVIFLITDAFDRFLGRNGPAYFEREKLTPPEAIEMIRDAGGLPVFAHPSFTEDYPAVAASLAADGLFGMEVFYKAYPPELVQSLHELATTHGLFALGGSDYHGLGNDDDREPGEIPLPDAVAEAYLAAAREAGCEVPEPAPGG